MSTPTATPRTDAKPCQATPFADLRQQIMDSRVPKNEREWWASRTIEKLETELAAAKAECNRLYESSPTALDALTAELARLRADLERFTGHGLLDCHAICDQRDAAVARAEKAEAEVERLKDHAFDTDGTPWKTVCGWWAKKYDAVENSKAIAIARAERAEAELATERARLKEMAAELAHCAGYIASVRTDRLITWHEELYALQTLEWAEGAFEIAEKANAVLEAHDAAMKEDAK